MIFLTPRALPWWFLLSQDRVHMKSFSKYGLRRAYLSAYLCQAYASILSIYVRTGDYYSIHSFVHSFIHIMLTKEQSEREREKVKQFANIPVNRVHFPKLHFVVLGHSSIHHLREFKCDEVLWAISKTSQLCHLWIRCH